MVPRVLSWPRLIGLFVILFGIGLSLGAAEFSNEFETSAGTWGPYSWPFLATATLIASLLVALGCEVFRSREWARQLLIPVAIFAILLYLAQFFIVHPPYGVPDWWSWEQYIFIGAYLGGLLFHLSPSIFFVLALRDPGVMQSFGLENALGISNSLGSGWPKLIGLCVIGTGIGVSLVAGELVLALSYGYHPGSQTAGLSFWPIFVVLAGCTFFVGLGYAVCARCNWARRILLIVTMVAILTTVALELFVLTGQRLGGVWSQLEIVASKLADIGEALRLVVPPVFFLFLLCHHDIVQSFRRSPEVAQGRVRANKSNSN